MSPKVMREDIRRPVNNKRGAERAGNVKKQDEQQKQAENPENTNQ